MTPLSYQGFGFTAILVMVAILSLGQLVKYIRERSGPLRHPTAENQQTIHSIKK